MRASPGVFITKLILIFIEDISRVGSFDGPLAGHLPRLRAGDSAVTDRVIQNEPAAELKPTGSVCLTPIRGCFLAKSKRAAYETCRRVKTQAAVPEPEGSPERDGPGQRSARVRNE